MHQKNHPNVVGSEDIKSVLNHIDKRFTELEDKLKVTSKSELPNTMAPNEVCKKLGISRSKFEQLKNDGYFKTIKIGGKVYVSTAEVQKLFPADF